MLFLWLILVALAGLFSTVIGASLTVGCIRQGLRARETAIGVIEGHVVTADDEGTYYAPTICFSWHGKEYRVSGTAGRAGKPEYRQGDQVTMYFSALHPEEATIGRFPMFWLALLPLGVGVSFLVGSAVGIGRYFRE